MPTQFLCCLLFLHAFPKFSVMFLFLWATDFFIHRVKGLTLELTEVTSLCCQRLRSSQLENCLGVRLLDKPCYRDMDQRNIIQVDLTIPILHPLFLAVPKHGQSFEAHPALEKTVGHIKEGVNCVAVLVA